MSTGPRTRRPPCRLLLPLLLAAALACSPPRTAADEGMLAHAPSPPRPRLALVLDDLGWSERSAGRVVALPGPVTLAVLPETPVGAAVAERGHAAGHEIILHQPMTPTLPVDPGPRSLSPDMDGRALRRTVLANLDALPHRVGLSNHMGSLLTSLPDSMDAMMEAIAPRGVYFLDSRTTPDSVAARSARAHAIPTVARDVFLDVVIDRRLIAAALERAVRLAEEQGHAVAIGHPHAATLDVLEARLPALRSRVRLVTVSELVAPAAAPRWAKGPEATGARPAVPARRRTRGGRTGAALGE